MTGSQAGRIVAAVVIGGASLATAAPSHAALPRLPLSVGTADYVSSTYDVTETYIRLHGRIAIGSKTFSGYAVASKVYTFPQPKTFDLSGYSPTGSLHGSCTSTIDTGAGGGLPPAKLVCTGWIDGGSYGKATLVFAWTPTTNQPVSREDRWVATGAYVG